MFNVKKKGTQNSNLECLKQFKSSSFFLP